MEEELELELGLESLERGLLTEVNGELDLDDILHEEREILHEETVTESSTPARNISSKILNYLGTLRKTEDFSKSDPKVWLMQTLLNEIKYTLKADGKFGSDTEAKVKEFQTDYGLKPVDGIVGRDTWSELIYQNKNKISNSTITKAQFKEAATLLGVEVEVVQAVKKVESNGAGFEFSNHPRILFESHIFWNQIKNPQALNTKDNKDILNRTWDEGKLQYKGGVAEFARLQKARQINTAAADASASWGLFQIMGFNYRLCGCRTLSDFVDRMSMNEYQQLLLFMAFIKSSGLLTALQKKDWRAFAKGYNGEKYEQNKYHIRLQQAYNDYKKGIL